MVKRRLLREVVLQALFVNDFEKENGSAKGLETLNYLLKENFPDLKGISFPLDLYNGVLKKYDVINQIIEKTAPDWPLDKIATVDRNILRMAIFEMLFSTRDDVPQKVAMNEGIELGKTFGAKNSYKFISGVLGSIYDAAPKKDNDDSEKKKKEAYENMPVYQKAGAVVFAKDGDEIKLAFVHDIFGYWTLSKGSVEEGETPEEACIREIKEEIGMVIKLHGEIQSNEYIANDPEEGKVRKQVRYFLGESKYKKLKLEADSGGLNDAKWFSLEDLKELKIYNDILPIIKKALEMVSKMDKK